VQSEEKSESVMKGVNFPSEVKMGKETKGMQ